MTTLTLIPNPETSATAEQIHNALLALLAPGSVAEVRLPETHKGMGCGYFDDFQTMASRAADWSGQCPAVYFTLNPVNPDLLSRARNRINFMGKKPTTKDAEIICRRWLPVDVDPIRPAGISSTEAEHTAALAKAVECKEWLTEQGWPAPLAGDSGNGANLLYRIELPNDEPSKMLVEKVLKALAQKFSDSETEIDTGVANAARIWKIYGTIAGKGDNAPDLGRPHRVSKLLTIPAEIQVVTPEQLDAIAALAPEPKKKSITSTGKLDAGAWLAGHSIALESQPYQGGTKYILAQCPLNPEHKKSAFVIQFPSGVIDAGCLHVSCAGLNWRQLQAIYEPAAAWRDALKKTETGGIKPELANAVLLLRNAPEWFGVLAYNEFSRYTVIKNPAPWPQSHTGAEWTDFDDSLLTVWLQNQDVHVNTRVAAEAAQIIAKENPFDPLLDYLSSLVWDGVSRINKWLHVYLGASDSAYVCAIGGAWLISAIARARQPGCKVDQILLLEGPQGSLKSTALETLCGSDFYAANISEIGSKDSRVEMTGTWIFELAELDRVRRAELSRIKAFFSQNTDVYRAPFAHRAQRVPRRCVFSATTNDSSSLVDETGNRRWWCVKVGSIDISALVRDRDLLWAEAVTLYEAGEPWWLDSPVLNEIAAREADLRYSPGVWDTAILNWCDSPEPRERRADDHLEGNLPFVSSSGKVTTADVLVHAIGKPFDKITYNDHAQVVRCLTHEHWTNLPQCRVKDVTGRGIRARFWVKKGII